LVLLAQPLAQLLSHLLWQVQLGPLVNPLHPSSASSMASLQLNPFPLRFDHQRAFYQKLWILVKQSRLALILQSRPELEFVRFVHQKQFTFSLKVLDQLSTRLSVPKVTLYSLKVSRQLFVLLLCPLLVYLRFLGKCRTFVADLMAQLANCFNQISSVFLHSYHFQLVLEKGSISKLHRRALCAICRKELISFVQTL
jgi:hypothetical protein